MENTENLHDRRVNGPVCESAGIKKKSGFDKFKENFFKEDFATVRDNAVDNVIIPSIKRIISDTISNSIDLFLYGEARHTSADTGWLKSGISRISYNSMFGGGSSQKKSQQQQARPDYRGAYDYGLVVVPTWDDAEKVISSMMEIISNYGNARVADLYDIVGETPQSTDNRYGWTEFASTKKKRLPDGTVMLIPPQVELLQDK